MAARRYSGTVRISVRWDDAASVWRCGVTWTENAGRPGEKRRCKRVTIGRAPADPHAVDSPIAFDETASAALSFTSQPGDASEVRDCHWIGDHAALTIDGSGWHIGRSPKTAWPRGES